MPIPAAVVALFSEAVEVAIFACLGLLLSPIFLVQAFLSSRASISSTPDLACLDAPYIHRVALGRHGQVDEFHDLAAELRDAFLHALEVDRMFQRLTIQDTQNNAHDVALVWWRLSHFLHPSCSLVELEHECSGLRRVFSPTGDQPVNWAKD